MSDELFLGIDKAKVPARLVMNMQIADSGLPADYANKLFAVEYSYQRIGRKEGKPLAQHLMVANFARAILTSVPPVMEYLRQQVSWYNDTVKFNDERDFSMSDDNGSGAISRRDELFALGFSKGRVLDTRNTLDVEEVATALYGDNARVLDRFVSGIRNSVLSADGAPLTLERIPVSSHQRIIDNTIEALVLLRGESQRARFTTKYQRCLVPFGWSTQ